MGDALGVPLSFQPELNLVKISSRYGFAGTYSLPAGTWSDDTSMTMCLAESLCKGLDYKDIMDNFLKWITTGALHLWKGFGVGNGTRRALEVCKEYTKMWWNGRNRQWQRFADEDIAPGFILSLPGLEKIRGRSHDYYPQCVFSYHAHSRV